MNKKVLSMIGAVAVALGLVVGSVVFTGMKTVASGAQITLSVDSPTVEKDEEIKVIVNASSGEAMSYVKAKLTYDANVLELVETSGNQVSGTNGEIHVYETLAYGENERSYELTFKALEIGAVSVNVEEGNIELYESLELVNISASTLPIEVVMNTSASDDARIKEMMVADVYDMDKIFDPNVFEYDLEVGVNMEMFIYSATAMNAESVIVAPEDLMLDIGMNRFEVRVTAPAGNEQVYVFNITRLDHEIERDVETESETETVIETETEIETEALVETEMESESEIVIETSESERELVPVPAPVEDETFTAEPLEAVATPVVE